MPERRRTYTLCVILVLMLLMGIPTVTALTLSAENAKIPGSGETIQVVIRLDEVPKGIAGYNISLAVGDPDVAEITHVALPLWAFPTRTSPLPDGRVWITGIDFSRTVQPGALDVVLATITLHGLKVGKTALKVNVVRIDDDGGYPVKPSIQDGIITIGEESLPKMIPQETLDTTSTIPETPQVSSKTMVSTGKFTSAMSPTPSYTVAGDTSTRIETKGPSEENDTDIATTGNAIQQEKGIFEQILSFFRSLLGIP